MPNVIFRTVIEFLLLRSEEAFEMVLREINAKARFDALLRFERKHFKVTTGNAVYTYDSAVGVDPIKHQILGPLRLIEKGGKPIFRQPNKYAKGRPLYYWELPEEERAILPWQTRGAFYCPVVADLFPENYSFDVSSILEKIPESDEEPEERENEFLDVDPEFRDTDQEPEDKAFGSLLRKLKQDSPEKLKEAMEQTSIRSDTFEVAGLKFRVLTMTDSTHGFSTMLFRPDGYPVTDYTQLSANQEEALRRHNELVRLVRKTVRERGYATGRIS
jgi:hypothetical protein